MDEINNFNMDVASILSHIATAYNNGSLTLTGAYIEEQYWVTCANNERLDKCKQMYLQY